MSDKTKIWVLIQADVFDGLHSGTRVVDTFSDKPKEADLDASLSFVFQKQEIIQSLLSSGTWENEDHHFALTEAPFREVSDV